MRIDLDDLFLAYRKAKVDLYYSTEPRFFDLVEYEENLEENLEVLLDRIRHEDFTWLAGPEFLGSFTFVPKGVKFAREDRERTTLHSDPVEEWRARTKEAARKGKQPNAQFRLMARCSIDFHVFSTLWMLKVGDKLDAALLPSAYGNRLGRQRDQSLNLLAPGTFRNYQGPYRRWRDDGIKAMQTALDGGQNVVAMTADATCFYHRLDPSFLTDSAFLRRIGVVLTIGEERLTTQFVFALRAWSQLVAVQTGWEARGLPVGLPASGVVANVALAELDRLAVEEFKPLYYGRYVDDVMIVLEGGATLNAHGDVWSWLAARSLDLLRYEPPHGEQGFRAQFMPEYLAGSKVEFENSKNKVFHLVGETGKFMLGSIRRTINERASEWRALPSVSRNPALIGTDLATITTSEGGNAANLRDSDALSSRRAGFSIRLRDFETYERILDPDSWATHRRAFFEAIEGQLLTLPAYFDLASSFPRLIKLAAACADNDALRRLFAAFAALHREVRDTCRITVASYDPDGEQAELILNLWARQVVLECAENLAAAYANDVSASDLKTMTKPLEYLAPSEADQFRVRKLREWHRRMFIRDLAHVPYRFALMRKDLTRPRPTYDLVPRDGELVDFPLTSPVGDALDELVSWLDDTDVDTRALGPGRRLPGLVLATRPFSALELHLALRGDVNINLGVPERDVTQRILRAIRGTQPSNLPNVETVTTRAGEQPRVTVPNEQRAGKRRLALGMIETSDDTLMAAVFNNHVLTRERFEQFTDAVEEVISRRCNADYLLLPELTMPPMWFVHFALRLRNYDTSLISGIEFRHGRPGSRVVHNQVWAALRMHATDGTSFALYRQDKQEPAPFEERLLRDSANLRLDPEIPWDLPPLVAHGDFLFGLLVCSELTDINNRAALRGRVDALMVPEWNKDLNTFTALVESAAIDVHAFIAQSNNRRYGDARIRAPFKEDFQRDMVRVRGGLHDYVVVGEIDYHALRLHQTQHVVLDGLFKPTPAGFEIAPERRRPSHQDL